MRQYKFKVGDIISAIPGCYSVETGCVWEVMCIIEGPDTITGPWLCGTGNQNVCDTYIVKVIKSDMISFLGKIGTINFDLEDSFQCINQIEKLKEDMSQYNSTCPRCKAPAYIGLNNIECSKRCN